MIILKESNWSYVGMIPKQETFWVPSDIAVTD